MACCHDHTHTELAAIRASLHLLHRKVDRLMSQQDDLNTEVQQIEADVAGIKTASDAIKTEIADLEAQIAAGQPVDLTGLKAAVADLDSAASDVGSIPPPATA